jgi:competence protein ComEC
MEGDAEKVIEREVALRDPRADLLKVAHNGSLTSTSPELPAAVRPRVAFISVGARNTFGHPRREILKRLEDSGVAVYRTDLNGAVTFYLDGDDVRSPASPH